MQCSICNDPIMIEPSGWAEGANAYPVTDGRCCHACDTLVVIPARLSELFKIVEPDAKSLT